ncbi:hypothetical protein [Streptomyces sp. NBC_00239]|uniref:hypothetical protein n=1 Tax=Streptomyces sp. NBC_00239 TaxID=2903640 RepID=UPI002E2C190A|nr:hypothetical protein [Streptomyces sp. NBC_00239]
MSSPTSAPGLLHGLRQTLEKAGVHHVSDAEAWVNAGGEVLCKVAVAPDERPDASAVPERLLLALRAGGYALAATSDSAAPESASPEAALRGGHAVRIIRN